MRWTTIVSILISGSCIAQWTQLPDFPGTARDDAASFAIDGRIYVGTGREVGFGYTNDWFCYEPSTESWSTISSMPTEGRQYCTTFTIADTGYVFGGTGPGGANNELWAYHPETDIWEQKASLPGEARYACVAATYQSNAGILATGMLASGVPTNETWRYEPAAGSWTLMDPVPGPARHRAACVEYVNTIAVIGGADSNFTALSDAWYYPGNEWYQYDSLSYPRWGADGSGNSVSIVACGATDQSVFHHEVWQPFGDNILFPDFPAGDRRGGVGVGISAGSQWWGGEFYYGLGLDGTFARRNDWWRLDVPVGIEAEGPIHAFSIYPVPAHDAITVALFPNAGRAELFVTTIDGRIILQQQVTSISAVLNTSTLATGAYLVTVRTATGTTMQRFVVQH